MTSGAKGFFLGVVNVFVVAVGFGLMQVGLDGPHCSSRHLDGSLMMLVFGFVPGVLTGWILGRQAPSITRFRLAKLAGGALAVVGFLALASQAPLDLSVLSAIPTVAAASILERWTRPAPSPLAAAKAV